MIVGTTYLLTDEPCLQLSEMELQAPDGKGFRRYQIYYVIRDDRLAEYRKDMGKAKKFKGVDQFRIPGGIVEDKPIHWHTVGQLANIADDLRAKKLFDKRELAGVNKIKT